jgi:hypothetical protein
MKNLKFKTIKLSTFNGGDLKHSHKEGTNRDGTTTRITDVWDDKDGDGTINKDEKAIIFQIRNV